MQLAARYLRTVVVGPEDAAEDPGGKLAEVLSGLARPASPTALQHVSPSAAAGAAAGGSSAAAIGSGTEVAAQVAATQAIVSDAAQMTAADRASRRTAT